MRAEDVGWAANKIVLGKLSGRNAFKQRLQELGIALEAEADVNAAFARFKELADRKCEIFDEDILALVTEDAAPEREHYSLSPVAALGNRRAAARENRVRGGEEVTGEERGNGPVDATLNAIETEVGSGSELLLYSVNAITTGTTDRKAR